MNVKDVVCRPPDARHVEMRENCESVYVIAGESNTLTEISSTL